MKPNSVSRSTGLFLEVSDDGLGNGQYGYRRFLVDVQSPTPVTADTQITVRMRALQWQYGSQSITAEVDGVLRAGETKTTVVVRLPQYVEWSVLTWDVWIDGVRDRYLSRGDEDWQQLNDNGSSRWRMGTMVELQITPGHGEFFSILPIQQGSALGENGLTVVGEWTDDWLDYTPFDVVSTDLPTLLMTETQNPEKLVALRRWVQAGGVLWVRSIGDDWERLRHLDGILGWATPEETIEPYEPTAEEPAGANGWSYVNLRRRWRNDPSDPNDPDAQGVIPSPDGTPGQPQFDTTPRYSTDWFVVRRCGWGVVAAYRGETSNLGPTTSRRDQFSAARYWRSHDWTRRHGLTPGQANEDFSKWLIPGVGLAPVVSFQVLITLFVIAIGPANYWLLKRAGRLHLIVLTVPIAAIAITGALLAYGLFSDGFSTRLRAQTITRLDQQTREATTWSRLSYYAAFAPRDGLTFSDQAAIYPIAANTPGAYRDGGGATHYEIEWSDGEQRLTKGWLASRTPTQYLAIEPRETDAGLGLELDTPRATVTNEFASEAQLIIVIDVQGDFLLARNVDTETPLPLERVDRAAAVSALREVLSGREPRNPDGYDTIGESSLISGRSSYNPRPYGPMGAAPNIGTMSGSLLDDEWQALLGLSGGEALTLPPRSYIVVSDLALLKSSNDEVAIEDSSVHIVIGTW